MRPFPGLVNSIPAVAYLFCLNLPAAFSQPGNGLIEIPCIATRGHVATYGGATFTSSFAVRPLITLSQKMEYRCVVNKTHISATAKGSYVPKDWGFRLLVHVCRNFCDLFPQRVKNRHITKEGIHVTFLYSGVF